MNFLKKFLNDDEAYEDKYKDTLTDDGISGDIADDIPAADGYGEESAETAAAPSVSLRVMRPSSYDDGPEIADYVSSGCTVVMNIEDLNRENARRLLDFLLGAVHVIGGDLQMASQTTFVVAPCSVDVADIAETGKSDKSAPRPKSAGGFTFK